MIYPTYKFRDLYMKTNQNKSDSVWNHYVKYNSVHAIFTKMSNTKCDYSRVMYKLNVKTLCYVFLKVRQNGQIQPTT